MATEISKMIVHKLNLAEDTPIFSDDCINLDTLDNSVEALSFFTEHINNMRNYGFTKSCSFHGSPANGVQNSIINIKQNEDDEYDLDEVFIDESKRITQKLRNEIDRTSSRSDGSIFIILCSINDVEFIGILKMDPNTSIEVTDTLEIIVRPSMLPRPNEKLHKSALIKFIDNHNDEDVHLFVLDRQQRDGETAKFFMSNFLGARELANNSNLTTVYQRAITEEFSGIIPVDSLPQFNDEFKRTLNSGAAINIDIDLPRIIGNTVPELRDADFTDNIERVKNKVLEKYPDATANFEPDPNKVIPTVYRSRNKLIEIKISPETDEHWYHREVDEETGEVIFRFSREARLTQER